MTNWELVTKQAKTCCTKEAWKNFFNKHQEKLVSTQTSKPISDIFKILSNDSQCLKYGPDIWNTLLSGCLSSWDLVLGCKIAKFCLQIPSAKIAIPAAEIYMESGSPLSGRKVAARALRLSKIEPWERLQLQMIVCNSYVEEGKHTMALRLLKKMEAAIGNIELLPQNLGDLLNNMARAQFFLGRYPAAAKIFHRAKNIFQELKNWETAARVIFNTAACYHNSGQEFQEKAFDLVSECKQLCKKYQLPGPLSHCYAFYGTDDYQHGNFLKASENYRKSLEYLPLSDKSFRRLHVTSMLAFTYLKLGLYQSATRIGKQTLELASFDDSERFRSRYLNLQAELNWESGDIEASQKQVEEAVRPFVNHGIHTLEELSTISRYYLQCSNLGETNFSPKVKISDQLVNNNTTWLEYIYSLSQVYLANSKYIEAHKSAEKCYLKAIEYDSKYYIATGLLSLIQTKLAQNIIDNELHTFLKEFKLSCKKLGETPLNIHLEFMQASIAYKQGEFKTAEKYLHSASKLKRISYPHQVVLNSWLATLDGHASKISSLWQKKMVAHWTKIYFSPTLKALDENTFLISDCYTINLDRHPILAKLLHYLLTQNNHTASPSDLQQEVWKQSLSLQGWQQKIRNTIMRMRYCFTHTMAPLILHLDNQVVLFHEAIQLKPIRNKSSSSEEVIMKLLTYGPMSTIQLSNKINISQATTKRVLKRLSEANKITSSKEGRKVFYHLQEDSFLQ